MEYKVSEQVRQKFDALVKDEKVQKALKFMEEDQDAVIDRQIELTLIPAPTYHEQKKAERMLEMFKEEGLSDCHIDEYGNCVGIRNGHRRRKNDPGGRPYGYCIRPGYGA